MLSPTALFSCKVVLDKEEHKVAKQILRFKKVRLDLSVVMDKLSRARTFDPQSSRLCMVV